MSEVSGVIQKIDAKRVGAQQKLAYNIQVGGQWYGCGFFRPKAEEGDFVTFTAVQNGNFWNVERGTLKVGKASAPDTIKQTVRSAVGALDSRQDTISRQAAANTAIEWVRFLHEAGALATTSKSKGALQETLDTIRRQYEKEFYEANTGQEWKDIRPNAKPEEDSQDSFAGESDSIDDDPWA